MIYQNAFLRRALPILIQTASAHRKPRWLPVAKSKIFRIPKRPEISEDEKAELKRLHGNYKTQMRAIRRFYFEEMIKENSSLQSQTSEMSQKLEASEWENSIALNEAWNKKAAEEREERRRQHLAHMEEYTLKRMEAKDKELAERIEKASIEIKKQKEICSTFITPETLDAAIEHALENIVDYNYAINLKGNRFEGRETLIIKGNVTEEQKAESAQ